MRLIWQKIKIANDMLGKYGHACDGMRTPEYGKFLKVSKNIVIMPKYKKLHTICT